MKLDDAQLSAVEEQLGVQAIPDEHPVAPSLREACGDHSFFLSAEGLSVVEPNPEAEGTGAVVKIASWTSDERTELKTHEPELLPVAVSLDGSGGADDSGA